MSQSAVAATISIWALEMIGFIVFSKHTWSFKGFTILLLCLLGGLASNVVIGAFQRVCTLLFALVYVIYQKDHHPEAKPDSVADAV